MQFGIAQSVLLFSITAVAATVAGCGDENTCLVSYGTEIAEALVQQLDPLDAETVNYAARAPKEQPLNVHFPTQTQNQTPEAVPNKQVHVQKRTDSSTPGTQIMSTWRQVVGGIAVAVLVAVV